MALTKAESLIDPFRLEGLLTAAQLLHRKAHFRIEKVRMRRAVCGAKRASAVGTKYRARREKVHRSFWNRDNRGILRGKLMKSIRCR